MAAQKMTVIFTFLVLCAFMEEANLSITHEVIICERARSAIICPPEQIIHILEASYGRHDRDTCPHLDEYTSNTNCHSGNSRAIVEYTCHHKNNCELFADNSVFGDWCEGTYKYLRVRYQCFYLFVLCEGTIGTLRCPKGKRVKLLQASYGRHGRAFCKTSDINLMTNTNCHSENTHTIVDEKCNGNPSCYLYADDSVFGDPCPETYKYLWVMYECEFVLCQSETGTLSCPEGKMIKLLQAAYGRHDQIFCKAPKHLISNTNCHSGNTHAIVEGKCHHKPSCELFADNSVFGDPCPDTYKYLRVMYECIDAFVLCQGSRGTVSCPEGKTIKLLQATYGRHDRSFCKAADNLMTNTNCHYEYTHFIVEWMCHDKPSCELFADDSVFGDPCPGTHKYLRVMYECI